MRLDLDIMISLIILMLGEFATLSNHRPTFHPGLFNVLGSPKQSVADKAIRELNQHSETMDLMGFSAITTKSIFMLVARMVGTSPVLRRGGVKTSLDWTKEPGRLTLENDKASMWSVRHLYDYIYKSRDYCL